MAETRADREARQQRAVALGRGPALVRLSSEDLGVDLALEADGSDLLLVEGGDALAQDLEVALTTGLGADPFDQSFGFDGIPALAEETDPILQRERIRIAIVRVLQRDPRITALRSVELVEPDAGAKAERRQRFVATFQVLDGSTSSLALATGAGR